MRIISGSLRGLKLVSLEGSDTRPTLDNVKEAIFSMLFGKVADAKVLDLFAGSGSLGLEALSRGAKEAVFVDLNPKACHVIEQNIEKARFKDAAKVCRLDANKFLEKAKAKNRRW